MQSPSSLRIALVAPVAQALPPVRSGSIETLTTLLADGLVARGHSVTLFATGTSTTSAQLHATFARGYREDEALWPWEMCELFNVAAAVERADQFDLIHCQAEYAPLGLAYSTLSPVPLVQTVHHLPVSSEVAVWLRYPNAPFVAVSDAQADALAGLKVVATIPHAVDTTVYSFRETPADYLLFLGRFTEGKGVLHAIDLARRSGVRLLLAAEANDYYREHVAPLVDGQHVVYAGEANLAEKVSLLGGARALLYPLQTAESFGLVLAEAAACGTPVAALRCGAVDEIVDGVTGIAFDSPDALLAGLQRVLALDRHAVRARAVERFGVDRMVEQHEAIYRHLAAPTETRR